MNANQTLEQYARVLDHYSKVKTKGIINKRTVFSKTKSAGFRRSLAQNDQRAHAFFINHHHVDTFAMSKPTIAGKLANNEPLDDIEVGMLARDLPETTRMLRACGYID